MTRLDDYQWLFRKSPAMATSIAEDGTYLDVNDALLDRLRHHCITVRINGPSLRVPEEPDPQTQDTPAEPEEPEEH